MSLPTHTMTHIMSLKVKTFRTLPQRFLNNTHRLDHMSRILQMIITVTANLPFRGKIRLLANRTTSKLYLVGFMQLILVKKEVVARFFIDYGMCRLQGKREV
jgi:hypothetical protein